MSDSEEWKSFLEAKGTLHIIVDLGEEPREYSELEDRIPISTSTLAKRLKEGVKLDAWELERIVTEEVDRTVYQLKRSGQHVYNGLEARDALDDIREVREAVRKADEVEDVLVSQLPDEE